MADSLHPWIADYLIGIGEEYGCSLLSAPLHEKKKKVQLIEYLTYGGDNGECIWAVISDKKYKMPIRFSKTAVEEFKRGHGKRLTEHLTALITIKNFQPFRSRIPLGRGRMAMSPDFTLALECDYLSIIGSIGEAEWGNPEVIQHHDALREWIEGLGQDGGAGNILKIRKAEREDKQHKSNEPESKKVAYLNQPTIKNFEPAKPKQIITTSTAHVEPQAEPKKVYDRLWRHAKQEPWAYALRPASAKAILDTVPWPTDGNDDESDGSKERPVKRRRIDLGSHPLDLGESDTEVPSGLAEPDPTARSSSPISHWSRSPSPVSRKRTNPESQTTSLTSPIQSHKITQQLSDQISSSPGLTAEQRLGSPQQAPLVPTSSALPCIMEAPPVRESSPVAPTPAQRQKSPLQELLSPVQALPLPASSAPPPSSLPTLIPATLPSSLPSSHPVGQYVRRKVPRPVPALAATRSAVGQVLVPDSDTSGTASLPHTQSQSQPTDLHQVTRLEPTVEETDRKDEAKKQDGEDTGCEPEDSGSEAYYSLFSASDSEIEVQSEDGDADVFSPHPPSPSSPEKSRSEGTMEVGGERDKEVPRNAPPNSFQVAATEGSKTDSYGKPLEHVAHGHDDSKYLEHASSTSPYDHISTSKKSKNTTTSTVREVSPFEPRAVEHDAQSWQAPTFMQKRKPMNSHRQTPSTDRPASKRTVVMSSEHKADHNSKDRPLTVTVHTSKVTPEQRDSIRHDGTGVAKLDRHMTTTPQVHMGIRQKKQATHNTTRQAIEGTLNTVDKTQKQKQSKVSAPLPKAKTNAHLQVADPLPPGGPPSPSPSQASNLKLGGFKLDLERCMEENDHLGVTWAQLGDIMFRTGMLRKTDNSPEYLRPW